MRRISVLIPCRNEEKYINDFLSSLILSDYPRNFMEVLFIDGKSTDATQSIISSFIKNYNYIQLIINENKTVPHALNLGIQKSNGDYIFILGAHSEIPNNYFSKLVEWSEKLGADNVGAVCKTEVKKKTLKTNSIVKVLSNKYGVGNSLFRIGTKEIREVDNISFGCYRREIYDRVGLYDIRLERNQDIELNKRNNFQTGFWNILTVYFTKKLSSLSFRHFIPLIFILSLITPLVAAFWSAYTGLISILLLLIYLFVLTGISIKIKDKNSTYFFILWSFIVLHFSYGFGSLFGIFNLSKIFSRSKNERKRI
jgi:glycosyltransferase involved in cell wall biosynthesis